MGLYFVVGIGSLLFWHLLTKNVLVFAQHHTSLATSLEALLLGKALLFNGPLWFLPSFLLAEIIFYLYLDFRDAISWFLYQSVFVSTLYSRIRPIILLIESATALSFGLSISNFSQVTAPMQGIQLYAFDISWLFFGYILLGKNMKTISKLLPIRPLPQVLHKVANGALFLFAMSIFTVTAQRNGIVDVFGRTYGQLPLFLVNSMAGIYLVCALSASAVVALSFFKVFKQVVLFVGQKTLPLLALHWPVLLCIVAVFSQLQFSQRISAQPLLTTFALPHDYSIRGIGTRVVLFLLLFSLSIMMSFVIDFFVRASWKMAKEFRADQ